MFIFACTRVMRILASYSCTNCWYGSGMLSALEDVVDKLDSIRQGNSGSSGGFPTSGQDFCQICHV